MPRYKKTTPFPIFTDFDTCYKCNSHNGPFVWCIHYNKRRGKVIYFLCEDCYEKIKREPLG